MLQKSARLAIAVVFALSLVPAAALAANGRPSDADTASSAGEGYAATQADDAPMISAIDIQGRTVAVVGSRFGSVQGASTVAAIRGGLGDGGAGLAVSVDSWSDTSLQLTLADDPTGIVDIEVVTSSGTARASKFVSAGPDVYEDTLALPPDYLPENYAGALPSSGILKGWGGSLYYLREVPTSESDASFAFHALDCYDIGSGAWQSLANLPEWLVYCSGAVIEGSFVVAGAVFDVVAGAPTGEERVYLYDIGQGAWMQLDASGVPLGAGIVNLDGQLMVVGGADASWGFTGSIYRYDVNVGIGSRVATLPTAVFNPQLAVSREKVFVYSYGTSLAEYNGSGAPRFLQIVSGSEAESVGSVFPTFVEANAGTGMPLRAEMFGTIVAATEGLMLVGPADAEGVADTYILDWSLDGTGFLPYYTRASDARLYGAAACVHDDRLYVAASSEVEPDNLVFRATEVLAPTVERGNYSVWRRGSKDPLTISFTPDISRFDGQVFIDGEELSDDSEFSAMSGSTVIEVTADYLSGLVAGQHEMSVDFDGGGASASAFFTVEGAADPLDPGSRQGRVRPASLAMTGDVLLVVPFAIVGVGAVALGVYLVRRKRRNL